MLQNELTMKYQRIIAKLTSNADVYSGLLKNKTESEYLWKPKENKWCLLEVVCHLYDEEREDFRMRVMTTLEKPGQLPPPIDPVKWVSERNYLDQDYDEMVGKFLEERKASIQYLESLKDPDWSNAYNHPELGPLTAEHFLTNWLAHDILHFRQIITLQFQYLTDSTQVDLAYAGKW